jgi:hypothetical protein
MNVLEPASPTIKPFLQQIYAEGILDADGNTTDILTFIKQYILQINALRGDDPIGPAAGFIREISYKVNDERPTVSFTDPNNEEHIISFSNLNEQLYDVATSESNVFQMIHQFQEFMDHLGEDDDTLIYICEQLVSNIQRISNALREDEDIGPMIQHIKDYIRNNMPAALPENTLNDENLASTVGGKRKTRKRNIRKTKKKGKGKRRRTHRRS